MANRGARKPPQPCMLVCLLGDSFAWRLCNAFNASFDTSDMHQHGVLRWISPNLVYEVSMAKDQYGAADQRGASQCDAPAV